MLAVLFRTGQPTFFSSHLQACSTPPQEQPLTPFHLSLSTKQAYGNKSCLCLLCCNQPLIQVGALPSISRRAKNELCLGSVGPPTTGLVTPAPSEGNIRAQTGRPNILLLLRRKCRSSIPPPLTDRKRLSYSPVCFSKLEIVVEISSTKWNISRRNNKHVSIPREITYLQRLPASKLSLL